MRDDAFSRCHPAVNFLFFVGAIGFGVVFLHPAYLLAGLVGALVYALCLNGVKVLKTLVLLLGVFVLIAFGNPLVNTRGSYILFTLFGRPYTLEALCYGVALGVMFMIMLLWFDCYNMVMTGDKFTCLFGNLIPSLSLVLVMVFRMLPSLVAKAKQIMGARSTLGLGVRATDSKRKKIVHSMTILSALTAWALEASVVTADSMRSRGYGAVKRTSFALWRMHRSDWYLLAIELLLSIAIIVSACSGAVRAQFLPTFAFASMRGVHVLSFAAYCTYLSIPTLLHSREACLWHSLKSKI